MQSIGEEPVQNELRDMYSISFAGLGCITRAKSLIVLDWMQTR
jgi:hypothetical protein